MIWNIEVFNKELMPSVKLGQEIRDLGINRKVEVYTKKIYFIESDASEKNIEIICQELLVDSVIEDYRLKQGFLPRRLTDQEIIITYNP
ncbi:MAG: phosphoribosylformylglycinamidine synthase subunit PurS, partial [Candidatus Omnitrophota bacterium]